MGFVWGFLQQGGKGEFICDGLRLDSFMWYRVGERGGVGKRVIGLGWVSFEDCQGGQRAEMTLY